MGPHPRSSPSDTSPPELPAQEDGLTLIAVIGMLAVITVGIAIWSPSIVRVWDRHNQETEDQHLQVITEGILTYLRHNKALPPSLAALSPDYVRFSVAQTTLNSRGFPRYYAIHPSLTGFLNADGLTADELLNTRFLLISDLSQDAAPTISTPAQFETWWTIDEGPTPNLKIFRGNIGHLFYSLAVTPENNGGSFSIHNQHTDSNGGLLPTHGRYHLTGTEIGFDEASIYGTPEVFFALTTNTEYWFDPTCTPTKQWNPLDAFCINRILFIGTEGSTIGTPGMVWTNSQIVEFTGPPITYEPGGMSGTFVGPFFDLAFFASGSNIDAMHYVSRAITIGTGPTFALADGDLLLSVTSGHTLVSTNTLTVSSDDVFVFRPNIPGVYTAGQFFLLLDGSDLGFGNIQALTLVEAATTVAGNTLPAGTFLIADGSSPDVYHVTPNSVGPTTTGTASVWIDGEDIGIASGNAFSGLELVETNTDSQVLGDVTLQSGQLIASLSKNELLGIGSPPPVPVKRNDAFFLDLVQTGATTTGTVTLLFNGNKVGLSSPSEALDSLALHPYPF